MIKFKRGTLQNWRTKNSTLSDGQPGLITLDNDYYTLKIGHGDTDKTFSQLKYLTANPMIINDPDFNWDLTTTQSGIYHVTTFDSGSHGLPNTKNDYTVMVINNSSSDETRITQIVFSSDVNLNLPIIYVRSYGSDDGSSSNLKWTDWRVVNIGSLQVHSFVDVQKIVRAGLAPYFFNIGDQLVCSHSEFGEIVWDIIGINHDTPQDSSLSNSLTIQAHSIIAPGTIFDAPETSNTDSNRKNYGNNNWNLSNVRQYLNSTAASGWFTATHSYDVAPSAYSSRPGFLNGFDNDFLSVIGPVTKTTLYPSVDGSGTYTTNDTMFLLSMTEVYAGQNSSTSEGSVYPYYSDNSSLLAPGTSSDTNRVKTRLDNGNTGYWWLRSAYPSYSNYVRYVRTSGDVNYNNAYYTTPGLAPACCII